VILTVNFLKPGNLQVFQGIGDGPQVPLGQVQVFRRRFQITVT
jgi:hypothetical protein